MGNRSGKSRNWCAPSAFCLLFHPLLLFFEIEVASSGVAGHLQHSVCSFTPPPNFLEIEVEVQELVGTLRFLCDLSHRRAPFFGNRSGSRRVRGHPQLFLCAFSPPAQFLLEIKVATPGVHWHLSFLSAFSTPPPHFLEIDVANPRVRGHPELFVYFFPSAPPFSGNRNASRGVCEHRHLSVRSFTPPPLFFSKSKWQITELVRTLSFLSAFSTPLRHFLQIEVPNPGSGVHPNLFLCLFTPPPSFFWKSKWQIQELVGTLHSLSAFSLQPLPPFFGNRTGSPGLRGTLKFFCGFSPSPHQFLEFEVANPRVGGHAELSVCLFTAGPIFAKSKRTSKSSWAPSLFCALFHPPPDLFSKSKWQIQELLGTSTFCMPFHSPRSIFWKSK